MDHSRSHYVAKFTRESAAKPEDIPTRPVEMNATQVAFISKMVMSELMELALATHGVYNSENELRGFMQQCFNRAFDETVDRPNSRQIPITPIGVERIAEQADALVDILYYVENAAVKSGINLEPIFHTVHGANERKRFEDGKYHRNAEGKVIKPLNWYGPDVKGEIERQLKPDA